VGVENFTSNNIRLIRQCIARINILFVKYDG